MYASEPTAIVSFIEKYKITDFLIEDYYYSHDYYSQEFSNNAHTFDGKEYQDIINTIRMNNENFFYWMRHINMDIILAMGFIYCQQIQY